MMALVWTDVETMEWREEEDPVPGDGEVAIAVESVGICGSELEGYLGHNSLRKPPLRMGHEFCGRIAETGNGVTEWTAGRKVVVNPLIFCGKCDSCRKGLTQLCAKRQIVGIHRPGGFAQKVVVPSSAVVAVPESLDPFRASLAEPLACALRAARRAMERHPFANVLVIGAGGIGLLSAMVARILGASAIAVADTNKERLGVAREIGFDFAANPAETGWREFAASSFGSKGVDVVIDAAGFQATREAAMSILNPGGTFMNIGLGIDRTELPINHLIRSEIAILGSFCYTTEDFADSVDLLASGRITERGWTEVRPLSEGGRAFADLTAGRVSRGKIFLEAR